MEQFLTKVANGTTFFFLFSFSLSLFKKKNKKKNTKHLSWKDLERKKALFQGISVRNVTYLWESFH